jgi:hypothetical protein
MERNTLTVEQTKDADRLAKALAELPKEIQDVAALTTTAYLEGYLAGVHTQKSA